MTIDSISSETELRTYLKPFAPFSVVDRGFEYATFDQVSDCKRERNQLSGKIVIEEEEFTPSCSLRGSQIVHAECSCLPKEEIQEQWCAHLIALVFKSYDQGLLLGNNATDTEGAVEEGFQVSQQSSYDIADTLEQARHLGYHCISPEYYPKVNVDLNFHSTALGIKVFYDNTCLLYTSPSPRDS